VDVITVTSAADRTISISISDFQPGEASSNPIVVKIGDEITVPATASNSNPVWYSIELAPSDSVRFTGKTANDYFYASLYESSNLNSSVAYSSSSWDSKTYTSTYYLAYKNTSDTTATYLLSVTSVYSNGATVIVSGKQAETTGITTARENATSEKVVVYDLQGRKLYDGKLNGNLQLRRGTYIVNGKKVFVK